MKKYMSIWLFAFLLVGFEYYALNFSPKLSLLGKLQGRGLIRESIELSAAPGRPISLWLGWLGLGLMVIMNLYSMRKRFSFMQGWGKLSDWLNFHVFCGLLGPTFILFHCNFKVRGIVGISFWSMVVSFTSGIVGRYFYVQMLREKNFFENESNQKAIQLTKFLESRKIAASEDEIRKFKLLALSHVGLPNGESTIMNPVSALLHAVAGDIRLYLKLPQRSPQWPLATEYILADYALNKRRALFLVPFQRLMGYWHTFHFPFAIFMYVVAVIHVIAALVLGA